MLPYERAAVVNTAHLLEAMGLIVNHFDDPRMVGAPAKIVMEPEENPLVDNAARIDEAD